MTKWNLLAVQISSQLVLLDAVSKLQFGLKILPIGDMNSCITIGNTNDLSQSIKLSGQVILHKLFSQIYLRLLVRQYIHERP